MTAPVIRRAETPADRIAAAEVSAAVFTPDDARWWRVCGRLSSGWRARADSWLLEEDGRVVCSLLSHPLEFVTPDGGTALGFGFGAVATLPEARGRGHAGALCQHVAAHEQERGRGVGLLFSAVPPGFYARFGWREVPGWAHETARLEELAACAPGGAAGGAASAAGRWHPVDPRHQLDELSRLYDDAHRGSLHMRRDGAGWARTWENSPDDLWLGLGAVGEPLRGFARLLVLKTVVSVVELVVVDPAEEEPALAGLAQLARELGRERLFGWLPPTPAVTRWFTGGDRSHDLPMVLGLDGVERADLYESDHF